MNEIQFTAHLGGKDRNVEISAAAGSGGLWHLYIDRYWHGQFAFKNGGWHFSAQFPEKFTPDTVEMLLDKLREFHKGK